MGYELGFELLGGEVPDAAGCVDGGGDELGRVGMVPVERGDGGGVVAFALGY